MRKAIHRTLCVLLTVVFVLSGVLSGTAAWQSANQQTKNELAGTAREMDVELLKLLKQLDGTLTEIPVPDAAFYLFTEDGKQIGGRYETDENGRISVQLPPGNYYFEEIMPAPGYDFDQENGALKTRYEFTVTGEETDPIVVRVYNVPLDGRLVVQKWVVNADNTPLTPEQQDQLFEFTVTFSDGGTYSYRVGDGPLQSVASGGKIYLKHGESAVFEDIPVGVQYTVVETPQDDYHTTSNGHQGNITAQGSNAVFVNTYEPQELGKITVTKEVRGEGGDVNKEFTFTAVINGETFTYTIKHGESFTIPDLPIGTQYVITETDYSADGYVTAVHTYTGTINSAGEVILPFVNVFNPPDTLGTLEVQKQVLEEGYDPDKVFTFEVTFEGENAPQSPQIFTLKAGEKLSFLNIPAGVRFTVREIDPNGYLPDFVVASGTIVGGETTVVVFRNRVPEPPDPTSILKVTKRVEGEISPEDEDKEFHITVDVNGEETDLNLKDDETVEIEVPGNSDYVVSEDDYSGDGFSQTITNGSGTIRPGETVEVVVTNTYVGTVYTQISGEKTWDLGGYPDSVLPQSIIVRLLHNGKVVEEVVVTPDENGKWDYQFNAPKYDADGNEIQYTIEEEPLYNFIPSYDGFNIKNTYIPPVSMDPPIIQKVVTGDNAPETQFQFLLQGQEGAPMPEGSNGNTKVVTLNGSGEVELGFITFTKPGVYVYTVTELIGGQTGWTYDEASYVLTVTVTETDGVLTATQELTKNDQKVSSIVFTNHYEKVEDPNKVEISGEKTWIHGDNPEENWPTAIVVQIYADGELIIQQQVTEKDDWYYSFDLPKYASDGHEIEYTINEAEIPDYSVVVDGYNLTNVYEPDTPDNPGSSDAPTDPSTPGIPPQTGDTSGNVGLYLKFCVGSGVVLAALLVLDHRRKKRS